MLVNIKEFRSRLDQKSFFKCSSLGNLKGLRAHLEEGVIPPSNILYEALMDDHPVESMAYILKWFHVHTDGLITHAVTHKNYPALELFFEYELPMSSTSLEHAKDDLAMLSFLIDRGCPMGVGNLLMAVCEGWVEGVKLLLEKGCPVNDYAIERARGNKELESLLASVNL